MEVKHKVLPKRKTYNYRKANWIDMNNDLRHVNWDRVIDFSDPFVAWVRFKTILSQFCDRYIPKKTVRSQFQPPWYDSECDKIRRMKEKWRKRAKLSNTESDHEKFRSLRKKFKQVMNDRGWSGNTWLEVTHGVTHVVRHGSTWQHTWLHTWLHKVLTSPYAMKSLSGRAWSGNTSLRYQENERHFSLCRRRVRDTKSPASTSLLLGTVNSY